MNTGETVKPFHISTNNVTILLQRAIIETLREKQDDEQLDSFDCHQITCGPSGDAIGFTLTVNGQGFEVYVIAHPCSVCGVSHPERPACRVADVQRMAASGELQKALNS